MANSYNELFGLGSHSEDANLEGWWPLQDDAASTVVDDVSSNARDFGLNGGNNTEDLSTTGPNGYLAKSLQFDGANDFCSRAAISDLATNISYFCWVYLDSAASGTDQEFAGIIEFLSGIGITRTSANQIRLVEDGVGVRSGPVATSEDTWIHVGMTLNGTSGTLWLNGSAVDTDSFTVATQAAKILRIGTNGTRELLGRVSETVAFSDVLTSGEASNLYLGPEAVYSSGASLGDDGAYSVGSWGLPSPFNLGSNGTITYEWVIANAAGSVVDSGSGSSGTADITSEAGNTVYLLVRASNTGGYDVGDKATRTSGYGSSGDGYYEVDSVVAAGGGGGSIVPIVMQLMAA